MKYRKKPVVIEAFQFNPITGIEGDVIPALFQSVIVRRFLRKGYWIKTLEGWHKVTNGDYIIEGIAGEYYPCKPDIFEATYELVE